MRLTSEEKNYLLHCLAFVGDNLRKQVTDEDEAERLSRVNDRLAQKIFEELETY